MDAGRTDADEQVLAAADHLVDPLSAQIDIGVPRDPDIAAGQGLSRQRGGQHRRGVENGVPLGHQRIRNPRGVRENPASVNASSVGESCSSSTGTPSTRSMRIPSTRRSLIS